MPDVDREVARILDAGMNRAREALRVVEDYARFARDDAAAAERAKRLRHELVQVGSDLPAGELLDARDVIRDVGREATTEGERGRASPEAVVRAALGRASEALRSLAEFAKTIDEDAARRFEALRYQAYDLEASVVLRGDLRRRLAASLLYVIVTESACRRPWLEAAEAALRGGARCLQLREKALADRELLARARALRELTRRYDALLVVNDRADVSRLCGADGVHVGQDDLSVAEVRSVAGGSVLVGRSTHTIEQLECALRENPDYVAVGPLFASPTKPQPHVPGPTLLAEAVRRTSTPIVAIGGITADNVGALAAAASQATSPCAGRGDPPSGAPPVLCVCSAVVGAEDPQAAAGALVAAAAGAGRLRGKGFERLDA